MRLICFKIVAYERAVWKDRKPAARTQFILSWHHDDQDQGDDDQCQGDDDQDQGDDDQCLGDDDQDQGDGDQCQGDDVGEDEDEDIQHKTSLQPALPPPPFVILGIWCFWKPLDQKILSKGYPEAGQMMWTERPTTPLISGIGWTIGDPAKPFQTNS